MSEIIPVSKPLLPTADKLRPYLERIDAQRYYSNLGPLTRELESRLADHFGVTTDRLVTSANGTLALIQVLNAFKPYRGSFCVMPSWTFTATPAAALGADLTPYFIDVRRDDWCIHPDDVRALAKQVPIGAVIPVSPFGAPIDLAAWEEFHDSTGIPVLVDAAAAFDTFGRTITPNTTLPYMVSLHATKVLGVGEGAVVVTPNKELAKAVRMQGNFGFYGSRESLIVGTNAKLSEYAAAVGLAELDGWADKRERWRQLTVEFERFVKQNPLLECAPKFNQGWISCYGLVRAREPLNADVLRNVLEGHKIGSIAWWNGGCHTQTAYRKFRQDSLENTTYLAKQVLGLPFWLGMTSSDFGTVFGALQTTPISSPVGINV